MSSLLWNPDDTDSDSHSTILGGYYREYYNDVDDKDVKLVLDIARRLYSLSERPSSYAEIVCRAADWAEKIYDGQIPSCRVTRT